MNRRKLSNFDTKPEVIKENLKNFPLNRINYIQTKNIYIAINTLIDVEGKLQTKKISQDTW